MRLKQVVRQQFSSTSSGIALNFQRPGQLLKTGSSFAGLTWLVVGNIEEKERFCSQPNNYVELCYLLDEFPQSIVQFNPLLVYFVALLACLCISSTPHAFTLAQHSYSYTMYFINNKHKLMYVSTSMPVTKLYLKLCMVYYKKMCALASN